MAMSQNGNMVIATLERKKDAQRATFFDSLRDTTSITTFFTCDLEQNSAQNQ
jgi:hypothetical protein